MTYAIFLAVSMNAGATTQAAITVFLRGADDALPAAAIELREGLAISVGQERRGLSKSIRSRHKSLLESG